MFEALLSTAEVAEVLGVKPWRVRHLAVQGKLTPLWDARGWQYFRPEEVVSLALVRGAIRGVCPLCLQEKLRRS